MSFTNDILRPITELELRNLKSIYKKNYLNTKFHYLTIYNQIKWSNDIIKHIHYSDNDIAFWNPFRTNFYTHRNGNLAVNGTFVSITKDLKTMISFHTLEQSLQELRECLTETERINWMSGPLLTGVLLAYLPFVNEIATKKGGIIQKSRKSLCYSIESRIGRNLNKTKLPFGYEMRKLLSNHTDRIHENWPNNKEGSKNFVKGLIILNKCYGIFNQKNSELVAWVLQNEYGGLGMLQVMPNERKQGLGTILATELTRDICNSEPINATAFIVEQNIKSLELFKKIGFEKIVDTMWIQYKDVTRAKL